MKKAMVLLSGLFLVMGLLSGGAAFAVGKKTESVICPSCNMKAVSKPRPKGGTYTQMKHLCPSCGKKHMGTATGETMHVCDQCGAEISQCPVCKQKS